ncbi:hypothetical protein RRG08_027933 [Elysia crispata]|uniref:Secreted protein n=1 Tax=Elysia crispata TaxID=231223 RepID=A0AAE1CTX1_9GAST|nr:hypothetical protein RRG08_027933 [Elysia crispata]
MHFILRIVVFLFLSCLPCAQYLSQDTSCQLTSMFSHRYLIFVFNTIHFRLVPGRARSPSLRRRDCVINLICLAFSS